MLEYGAKATNATVTLPACTSVTSPGSPVCFMPALWIAWMVWSSPACPKSCEWLLASLRTVKPSAARYFA